MPVSPNTPEPLKAALESMEASVQSTKYTLGFAAPEMQDQFWGALQIDLAGVMAQLYEEAKGAS